MILQAGSKRLGLQMSSFDSMLRLPDEVEARLRELLRRKNEGSLTDHEQREMSLLIEVRETLSALRTKAAALASATPQAGCPGRTVRNGLPVVVMPPETPAIDPAAVRRSLQEEGF
jgi:hypothetical protein